MKPEQVAKILNEEPICSCCGFRLIEHEEHELCSECFNEIKETAEIIGYRKGE